RIEALTMLAAVAPLTSRVALGTAALLPVLRRPVQAAQTLASIDLLSGGRLVLAVGAAFPGRVGRPPPVLSGGAGGRAVSRRARRGSGGSPGWTRPSRCGGSCGPLQKEAARSRGRCSASRSCRR